MMTKRTMSEAQKRAMAEGRAKRRERLAAAGLSERLGGDQNASDVIPAPPDPPRASGAQQGTKESPHAGGLAPSPNHRAVAAGPGCILAPVEDRPKKTSPKLFSSETVLFPESFFVSDAAPSEPTPPTDASVRAEQARYVSEDWKLVRDGSVLATGTADSCYVQALSSRNKEPDAAFVLVDPNGCQVEAEMEVDAARLARQARNWSVERQNGGIRNVVFKGTMEGAERAYEDHVRSNRGGTVVLLDGTEHPVDQVCRPQFRTTINGPDEEIKVDSESYKKYVDAGGVPKKIEAIFPTDPAHEPRNTPTFEEHLRQMRSTAESPIVAPIDGQRPEAPVGRITARLEEVSVAIVHLTALLSHLRDERSCLTQQLSEHMGTLRNHRSSDYERRFHAILAALRGLP